MGYGCWPKGGRSNQAEASQREAWTIGNWLANFRRPGPKAALMVLYQEMNRGGVPPVHEPAGGEQNHLKSAGVRQSAWAGGN